MKSKKLISFLCAAAMTTSAFAGLTVASAAATPVWSFDGSSADGWDGTVAPTLKTDEGSTDQYLNFEAAVGKASNDTTFVLPTAAQLTDDYVLEYDTYIHGGNGMGRLNHYTQVAFAGESPTLDTQHYGGDYATAAEAINPDPDHHWSQDENTGNGYTTDIVSSLTSRIELSCQGRWVINQKNDAPNFETDGTAVGDDKWVRVRAEVKGGKAKVTIADSNQTYVDGVEYDTDATRLAQIKLTFGRADGVNFVPTTASTIKLDNIKVYNGIASTPAFSTADLRKTAVVATPVPRAENVAGPAPNLYAPEGAIAPYKATFDDAAAGTILSIGKEAQDPKPIVKGLTLNIGNRPDGEDTMSYGAIVDVKDGSKALKLQANNYATNGRGPVVSFDDDLSIDDMTGTTSVLGFAVYLSKTAVDGIERLFLIDNTTNVDGNSCARDVVAVLTTEDIQNEDESYKYTAGEKNIGVHLEPEQWNTVALAISENEYRIFVNGVYKTDGRLSPALKNDLVGTGEGNKNPVLHLPMLAIENTKASSQGEDGTYSGGTVFSSVLIDNVLTYQIQAEVDEKLLPQTEGEEPTPVPATPTPAPKHVANITYANGKASVSTTEETPFDGVLIAANYRADGTLEKVALTKELTGISSTAIDTEVAMAEGDKLMVWNNLKDMIPYGTYTVTAEQASATKAPANTPMPTPEPTATPEVTADPNATDTPATEAPAPKYAVTGTVDTGVKSVTLTDKTDNTKTISGTIAETAVTFANVPAGTYTVTAEAKTGYKDLTIKKGETAVTEVTVTDADVTDAFAVTTTAIVLPDISAKTVMAESDFSTADTWGFTAGRSGFAPVVEDGKLVLTKGNNGNDGKQPQDVKTFDAGVTASADTEIMFDYNPQIQLTKNRWSSLSLTDSEDKVIFSLTAIGTAGKDGMGYAVGQRAICADNAIAAPAVKVLGFAQVSDTVDTNKNTIRVYLHVAGGKVSGLIFDVTDGKSEFLAEVPETAIEATNVGKLVAQEGYSFAPQAIDNVKIVTNDTGWKPAQAITVTAPAETDGTLAVDKTSVVPGTTVTITATAKPGKKVASVTVMNGETAVDVTAGENGTYTFTMPEADVTVSATYARADIDTIEVSGPKTVSSVTENNYTAVAKAADGTVLEGITFTWSVTGGGTGTSITDAGALTVAEAEADNAPLTVKASAEEKEGTLAVTVTKKTVYTITNAAELTGGSVATDRRVAIEGAEVVVTPTAAAGYHVTAVTYTPAEGTAQTITPAEGVYKFTMPAANVTVSATFAKTDYAITNATAADAGGTITVAATAQMGDTVTVTATPAEGKEFDAITVVPTTEGSTTTITVTGNTFVMPAEPVTVTATFANPVPKYVEFADGKIQAVTVSKNNADKTYAQLKKAEATLADVKVEEGVLLADQGKLDSGKYSSLADAATIIKVDASSAGTSKVELGFKATCTATGKNSDVRIAKIDISDIGAATYNTIAGIAATGGATIGNGNASGVSMKYDITADIAADEDKVLYYVIYTYTARQQKLTDLALTVTPLYTATVTVKDDAETPAAVADADVTIKSGDTTVATGKTTAEGTFTANLEAGSYTVDVTKDGYANVTGTALTVAAEGANSVNITLQAQSDPTFPVTVNTAPFASVKLNAGTSTAGTEVATQTVTANENGVATLADVPAGDYTVDVTSANSYLANKTGVSITAAKDTPVTVALEYKDTTMVYGEDFSYTAGTSIIGVNETKGIITNSNALYSGMSVSVGGVNKTGGNVSPISEGNNFGYYSAGFNVATNYTLTYNPNKKITKIAFDAALGAQTWAGGGAGSARGNAAVTLTIGNIVLVGTPSSSAETVTITDGVEGNTKTATSALTPLGWARYEIEIGDDNAVTVKITPAGGDTETITGLTMSADATTAVFTGSKLASFAVDNFEIYAVAATPAE